VNGEPINAKRWESLTQEVQALQAEWRTIGFAPKKFNQAIYDEYRAECDRFFHAKAEYFREIRDTFATNLKRKRALLDQVLAINAEWAKAEWTKAEWDEATKRIVDLQAEWKTIGAVTRKFSEDLWKQFTGACDAFFAAKREAAAKARGERREAKAQRAVQAAASQGIEALRKMRDRLQQEIKTAENNILFFTSKSKTTNKLVEDMQRKIDALKAKLEDIKAQIEAAEED
jgi:chromosome segregation ATPase